MTKLCLIISTEGRLIVIHIFNSLFYPLVLCSKGKERKGKERKGREGKERKGKERKGKERKGKERKEG